MSPLLKPEQVLHLCHGNAQRTIDKAHFALLGLFLTISEHIFKFLCAGPHDEQNDTLHKISLGDTS